ncbi:MAG TPA: T9SS type A sorting domain-containing protein [Bacteroidales bacterium]|nr:T9SS type A sorting domain-containing protein [Bacteroidales bacterium]
MRKIVLSAFMLLLVCAGFAQEKNPTSPLLYHADDMLLKKAVTEKPELINQYMIYEENLKNLLNSINSQNGKNGAKTDTLIDGKRIIPVVFHIVHNGGPENISREQIEDAIKLINIDYNKLNADTTLGHTYPPFNALRADCKIEFRLAKVDPNGNCTDGIMRHYDPQTNYGYFKTMTDYCWTPSRYLNVFTVNFIYPEGMSLPDGAFIGGMSPFPPSNTLSSALTGGDTLADGVLIRHDCIGSIGTATAMGGMPINAINRTFTHESGHYFNLYHTFQSLLAVIGVDGCLDMLGSGDEVADTPPVSSGTQNTSLACYEPGTVNSCTTDSPDLPDMIENYMDYQWGYCANMFSLGQYARIDATLLTDRLKLWSKENLIYTGVLDTTPVLCAPIAEFFSSSNLVCAGGNIQFTDYSYSGAVQDYLWTFEGGTPATSTDQNPLVVYNNPGTYFVKLSVSNASGADSLIKQDMITVKPATAALLAPFMENFETAVLNNGWIVKNDVGNQWEISDTAYFSASKALRLKNFTGNTAGSFDEIITPAYDLTSLPAGGTPFVRFKLAYAGKISSSDTVYDALKMFVSKDCGETWSEKYTESGATLGSATATSGSFAPATTTDWKEISRPLPGFLTANNVMFKFVFHSNGGNNVYIDDINVTTQISGCEENLMETLDFTVQPNPVADVSQIKFALANAAQVSIIVYDILGNEVKNLVSQKLNQGAHVFELSKSALGGSGVYIVKASFNGNGIVKKIVVE